MAQRYDRYGNSIDDESYNEPYVPKEGEYGSSSYKYIPGYNQPMAGSPPGGGTAPLPPVPGTTMPSGTNWQDRLDPRINATNISPPVGGTSPIDFLDFVRQGGYTGAGARQNLPDIVAAYNQRTGQNYRATGRPGDYDTIQQSPGGPNIDVVTSGNQWWWGPEGQGGGDQQSGGDRYQSIIDQLVQQLAGRQQQTPQTDPALMAMLQAEQQRQSGFQQNIRDSILGILNQKQQTPQDMLNTPEANAYRVVSQRALEAARAQAAEGRAGHGVGQNQFGEQSGALGQDITQGHEQLAERLQAFESQIVQRELGQRRQQLSHALQMGAGILGQDQEAALRRELSQIDAQLRHKGLGLGLLQALLGNQFNYDQLGYNLGGQEAIMNHNTVGALG